jgi:[ribosomal protein S5]-alanine N-acetyltransferase
MLQPNFTPFPVLKSSRLLLRQITMPDAAAVFYLRSNETVLQYLDKDADQTLQQTIDFIEMINKDTQENNSITWGIALQGHSSLIGTIGYWRMQKQHHRAEIGYMLHPHFYRQGIMQEAMQTVLEYGFTQIKLHSVEANINPANEASRRLLLKSGFVKEAYFRQNYFYNGNFTDSEIYALLTPASH